MRMLDAKRSDHTNKADDSTDAGTMTINIRMKDGDLIPTG